MVKKGKKKPLKVDPTTKKANKEANKIFEEGTLVVAKVKGYPYWPARVEAISQKPLKYSVRFFATNDEARVDSKCIMPFKDFTPKQCDLRKKTLNQAFKLCEEEYDSQIAAKESKHHFSPAPSLETAPSESQSTQSHVQFAPSEPSTLPKISTSSESSAPEACSTLSDDGSSSSAAPDSSYQDKSSIQTEKNSSRGKMVKHDELKLPTKIKSERVSPRKSKQNVRRSPSKLDTRTDNNHIVLPKVKREESDNIDFIIKKLQSKVDEKMKELARMKQEETEKKRILKSTEKLVKINKKLSRFLKSSQHLNTMTSESHPSFIKWKSAADEFKSLLQALVKCIEFLLKKRRSNNDLRNCRDILTDLVRQFKSAKDNDKLPRGTIDEIKSCLNLMRNEKPIKDFINKPDIEFSNGKQENAMIERKENSAHH